MEDAVSRGESNENSSKSEEARLSAPIPEEWNLPAFTLLKAELAIE